jgi:hypothetical protein
MAKIIFLILFMTACAFNDAKAFEVSKADTLLIAKRVFKNECKVEKDCLLEWGAGEDFLSLGLEHFIWYPPNAPNIFKEGFRSYLQFARQAGERLPVWLDKTPFPPCPWASREEFLNSKGSQQYNDLMDFMLRSKDCQAKYLIENTKRSLKEIVAAAPADQRSRIAKFLSQLTSNAQGLYSIIDYLDFKGAGVGNSDEFKGERWGLLQVLQGMRDVPTSQDALDEFVRSAKMVLTHRVFYAPADRHEEKWLQGWLRRIDTYLVI